MSGQVDPGDAEILWRAQRVNSKRREALPSLSGILSLFRDAMGVGDMWLDFIYLVIR